ncbi:MAG: hypothetical protein HKK66_10405 [Chlorobiaceae bacterium]|nr:hypothetical protein [Chlorobiaceae bacterium]
MEKGVVKNLRIMVVFAVTLIIHKNVLAFDVSGRYSFKAKGMVGKMIVKEVGSKITVDINTANNIPNVCDLQATGSRVRESKKSVDAYFDYDEDKFEIIFNPTGATIKMLTEVPSICCGRGAYYDGRWSKDRHRKTKNKPILLSSVTG